MPNTSFVPSRRHAGTGELLGEDHLLERTQPGAAVLDRPTGGEIVRLVQVLRHSVRNSIDRLALEGTGALPVGRQLLGEEGLHLLAVGLGIGGVGRLHGNRG